MAASARESYDKCVDRIIKLYNEGALLADIAEECGMPVYKVRYILKKLRRQGMVKPRRRQGTRRNITREEAEEMRRLYEVYGSIYIVARLLGRSPSTVYYKLKQMGVIGGGNSE